MASIATRIMMLHETAQKSEISTFTRKEIPHLELKKRYSHLICFQVDPLSPEMRSTGEVLELLTPLVLLFLNHRKPLKFLCLHQEQF